MGTFDIVQSAPGLLRNEALNITMTFQRTGPNTGRVSWNIPSPAAGCASGSQAYAGMVIAIDTVASTIDKSPSNGTVYNADSTVDSQLFAGDKLGTAYVVGAFYDTSTIFFDVTGLKPNTPYYVTGYPVDAQYRYFVEGVHTYSLDYTNQGTPDTNGSQVVVLNSNQSKMGVNPTDATGLPLLALDVVGPIVGGTGYMAGSFFNAPLIGGTGTGARGNLTSNGGSITAVEIADGGTGYLSGDVLTVNNASIGGSGAGFSVTVAPLPATFDFDIQVGITPVPLRPIDSVECTLKPPTYNVTVASVNSQTYQELVDEINSQLTRIGSHVQGISPPNTGTYYRNATTGLVYIWDGYVNNLVEGVITQSTAPDIVNVGQFWFNPTDNILRQWNGLTWDIVSVLSFPTDPTQPQADRTYWFDGSTGYLWNGSAWCSVLTYVQSTNPSLPVIPDAGSFWHDTTTNTLYRWDMTIGMWFTVNAIESDFNPNTLVNGSHWFNTLSNTLYVLNTPSVGWNLQTNVSISETAPTTPAPGKYWFNPTNDNLFQWSGVSWVNVDVVIAATDPTSRSDCDLWWNTSTGELSVWDTINAAWVIVTALYSQGVDPSLPLNIEDGTLWFNTTDNTLNKWTNNCFKPVQYIDWPLDPVNNISAGAIWFNTTTNNWYQRDVTPTWTLIAPVISIVDLTTLTLGTLWFNTTNQSLQQWNGVGWVTIAYSTVSPAPTPGTIWFDTSTNTSYTWNNNVWTKTIPVATCELDCNGNLLFTDTTRSGSTSFILITDHTLFKSLNVITTIHDPKPGTDGASDTPSYMELGIGTDGSDDARALLANEIRYELGYPVVDVELTKEQIDYAITRSLGELRAKSGIAYKRGFFFMSIPANNQKFYLTNKISSMNKIVDVLGVYRLTSSFLSSAHGAGVYGQIVLQHMYNMGTFDLLSYHIMAEYTKLMEILFAARVTFTWNEQNRELFLHHRFAFTERMVCIDATTERSEQDLITDRYCRPWIRRYALATSRLMLAESRGKFSTLPGAGGNVSLNANELRTAATQEFELCAKEIDEYVVDRPEEYGMMSSFTFG